jgi:hypothetical protein
MFCHKGRCVSRLRHTAHDTCWKEVYNMQTVTYVLYHELFWNPSCTDFTEVKSVVESDFIVRTVANLQTAPYFTDSNPPAEGRAIAQAVSRWLPTAAARVQTRVC